MEIKVTMNTLCQMIQDNLPRSSAEIRLTWIDYGAKWQDYTVIVTEEENPERKSSFGRSYQALTPREIHLFKEGRFTLADAEKILSSMIARGW